MKNGNTKTSIYPYVPAMSNKVELWLEHKTKEGWRLIDKRLWTFRFIKCKPYESKYFMYQSFDASKGLFHDYHMVKNMYAITSSLLNKRALSVFEVDLQKIDKSFWAYGTLRDKHYCKHYLSLLILSLPFLIVSFVLAKINIKLVFITFAWGAVLSYALFSLIVLQIGKFWRRKRDNSPIT